MQDLKNLPNPYDFANPVSDERMLIGRDAEISDVTYYLKYAAQTNKPIHIAFVGARASGKTSLLNVTEIEAKRRDFCVVRINLNEGDVQSDISFFRKFFHSILISAFDAGAFGGKKSKAYFAYLELASSFEIKDPEQFPLVFGYLLAKANKAGNTLNIPDDILAEDLKTISNEISKPFALLIDECNVLTKNRVILEKIRNIFMNLAGYMMVLSATETFFPTMDEVFSPIMRQFRRIDVGPFKGDTDVRQCILRPLFNLGLTESDSNKLAPTSIIRDIDVLSGRRAYEIQLICHTMFRQCQEGQSKRFSLDLPTIESIKAQLASGQNLDERPLIRAARQINRKAFGLLEFVCRTGDTLKANDWWRMEHVFWGTSRWTEPSFYEMIDYLQKAGLIQQTEMGIEFKGDAFESLFLKYVARQKSASFHASKQSFEMFFYLEFLRVVSDENVATLQVVLLSEGGAEMQQVVDFFDPSKNSTELPEKDTVPAIDAFVTVLTEIDEGKLVTLLEVEFSSNLGAARFWIVHRSPEAKVSVKKLEKKIADIITRGGSVGVTVAVSRWNVLVPNIELVCAKVKQINDEQLSMRLSAKFGSRIAHYYTEVRNPTMSKKLAEVAYELSTTRKVPWANNIAYLYMASSNFSEAELWLVAAEETTTDDSRQLVKYNRGVVRAMTHDYAASIGFFTEAMESRIPTPAACAHKLALSDSKLTLIELHEPPPLKDLAVENINLLKIQMKSAGPTVH